MASRGGAGGGPSEAQIRSAFREVDTSNNGYVDKAELGVLLSKLTGRTAHQNDVLFCLREIDTSHDGRISYTEFRDWFIRAKIGHKGSKYNKLLVRDVVGKSKRSSYDLPSKDFTFGYTVPQDKHDAKATMSGWHTGKPRLGGSEILRRRAERGAPKGVKAATFGQLSRPSTPMGKLLRGEFGVEDKDKEYPQVGAAASPEGKRSRPAAVRATRSTLAAMERTRELLEEERRESEKAGWKLKKFKNVKSRVFE
mmetsp:Transcript_24115/g.83733  ORF Transcript_24115/g.83733 Transcript_24115/m.83733 type:complete len:253 (-) Transcript_24115:71-829(-)